MNNDTPPVSQCILRNPQLARQPWFVNHFWWQCDEIFLPVVITSIKVDIWYTEKKRIFCVLCRLLLLQWAVVVDDTYLLLTYCFADKYLNSSSPTRFYPIQNKEGSSGVETWKTCFHWRQTRVKMTIPRLRLYSLEPDLRSTWKKCRQRQKKPGRKQRVKLKVLAVFCFAESHFSFPTMLWFDYCTCQIFPWLNED